MHVKQRNTETVKFKEQKKMEKQLEEQMLQQRNQNLKNNIKENIQLSKEQHQKKLYDEAERLKQEKKEQFELMQM